MNAAGCRLLSRVELEDGSNDYLVRPSRAGSGFPKSTLSLRRLSRLQAWADTLVILSIMLFLVCVCHIFSLMYGSFSISTYPSRPNLGLVCSFQSDWPDTVLLAVCDEQRSGLI